MIAGVDEHRVGTVSADIVRSLDAGLPQAMINRRSGRRLCWSPT